MGWKPFPYTPLRGTEIRYITIHRLTRSTTKIQCTLRQAPLEDLDFYALSYVWGDAKVTETILLSGKPFRATTNLVACLNQLAARTDEINLWVDAICINQNDVDERNVQFQRMQKIYSAAYSVVVWLGQSTSLSRIGVQRLRRIDPRDVIPLRYSEKEEDMKQRTRILNGVLDGDGGYGLRDLLCRPYWHRTWIIQEFALGRRLSLICGEDEIPFDKLYSLANLLIDSMILSSDKVMAAARLQDPSHVSWCSWVEAFFADVQDGALRVITCIDRPKWQLQDLLSQFKSFKCSDDKDRIYALLAISDNAEGISPNYSNSTSQVYGEVVQWLVKKHGSLDILSMACYHGKRNPSHASWIPDWRGGAPDPHGFVDSSRRKGEYSASKGLSVFSHPWSLDNTAGRLNLSGACLDTISSLSKIIPGKHPKAANLRPVLEWLWKAHKRLGKGSFVTTHRLGHNGGRYPLNNDEPLAEACRRTLVADCDTIGTSPARSPFMMLLRGDKSQRRSDGSIYDYNFTERFFVELLKHRRLAITSKGWIGLVQKEAAIGDYVAVLIGASVPFILRKSHGNKEESWDNQYTLIGDAYIHGLMHGQGLDLGELREIILC